MTSPSSSGVRVEVCFTALLLVSLLVTNRYLSLEADAAWVRFAGGDSYSYLTIANAFPSLPYDATLWLHKSQRFVLPYVLGGVARMFGVPVEQVFRGFAVLVVLGVVVLFRRILRYFALSIEMRMVLLGILILNAYMFRYHLAIPWMVSDLGFQLGVVLVLLGLLGERPGLTYVALLFATLSKQTALTLIPGVMAWIWLEWNAPRKVRVAHCLIVAALGPLVYLGTTWMVMSFSKPRVPIRYFVGLVEWIAGQFSLVALSAFTARGLIGFALPVALFLSLAVTRALPGGWYRNRRLWLCLALTASIDLTPFLAGPVMTGHSMPRLTMLGYVPVLVGLGIVLADTVLPIAVQQRLVFVSAFAAAIGSFHHFYSFLGVLDPGPAGKFAAVYLASALLLFVGSVVSQRVEIGTGAGGSAQEIANGDGDRGDLERRDHRRRGE